MRRLPAALRRYRFTKADARGCKGRGLSRSAFARGMVRARKERVG